MRNVFHKLALVIVISILAFFVGRLVVIDTAVIYPSHPAYPLINLRENIILILNPSSADKALASLSLSKSRIKEFGNLISHDKLDQLEYPSRRYMDLINIAIQRGGEIPNDSLESVEFRQNFLNIIKENWQYSVDLYNSNPSPQTQKEIYGVLNFNYKLLKQSANTDCAF